jgi:hypothetical protein
MYKISNVISAEKAESSERNAVNDESFSIAVRIEFPGLFSAYQGIGSFTAAASCETNGGPERDIRERRAKIQEGIKSFRADFLSNHEADDYPFRFSSTGFDKLHPCGKV